MYGGLNMYFKKFFGAAMALMLTAGLASCNIGKAAAPTPDVNALYTAAAGTMLAQLGDQQTQTAAAVSPTPFSSPTALDTFTPLPTFPIGVTPFGTPFGTPFTFGTPGALTPLPTSLTPGITAGGFAVGCNNAVFVAETIPDKTVFTKGKKFSKAWEFLNTGTCQWDQGYGFYLKSGDQLTGQDVVIPGSCAAVGAEPRQVRASAAAARRSPRRDIPRHS
jgi:hypothetical protein